MSNTITTVLLARMPIDVTIKTLAGILDNVFDTDEIGSFRVRKLPLNKKWSFALDFKSNYDAFTAQSILDGYRYSLGNGEEFSLKPRINNDPRYAGNNTMEVAPLGGCRGLMPMMSDKVLETCNMNLNAQLKLLKKKKLILQTEREILHEKRRLEKEYKRQVQETGQHTSSESEDDKPRKKRKKCSKHKSKDGAHRSRSKSAQRSKSNKWDRIKEEYKQESGSPNTQHSKPVNTCTTLVPYKSRPLTPISQDSKLESLLEKITSDSDSDNFDEPYASMHGKSPVHIYDPHRPSSSTDYLISQRFQSLNRETCSYRSDYVISHPYESQNHEPHSYRISRSPDYPISHPYPTLMCEPYYDRRSRSPDYLMSQPHISLQREPHSYRRSRSPDAVSYLHSRSCYSTYGPSISIPPDHPRRCKISSQSPESSRLKPSSRSYRSPDHSKSRRTPEHSRSRRTSIHPSLVRRTRHRSRSRSSRDRLRSNRTPEQVWVHRTSKARSRRTPEDSRGSERSRERLRSRDRKRSKKRSHRKRSSSSRDRSPDASCKIIARLRSLDSERRLESKVSPSKSSIKEDISNPVVIIDLIDEKDIKVEKEDPEVITETRTEKNYTHELSNAMRYLMGQFRIIVDTRLEEVVLKDTERKAIMTKLLAELKDRLSLLKLNRYMVESEIVAEYKARHSLKEDVALIHKLIDEKRVIEIPDSEPEISPTKREADSKLWCDVNEALSGVNFDKDEENEPLAKIKQEPEDRCSSPDDPGVTLNTDSLRHGTININITIKAQPTIIKKSEHVTVKKEPEDD